MKKDISSDAKEIEEDIGFGQINGGCGNSNRYT